MIELHVPVHAGLDRREDRAVLAEPRPEHLLEPHREERTHAEQPDAVRFTGRHQRVEHVPLVLGRHPDLVAEVAGVGHAADPARCHADVERPDVHEAEVVGADVEPGDRLQHVARRRPGERQPGQALAEHLERELGVGRAVSEEPTPVAVGGAERAEEQELVVAEAGHRELAHDPSVLVEHRRQIDASDRRQRVGEQTLQPVGGAGPGDGELREVRDLGQADPLTNGERLLADEVERVGPPERDLFDRLLAPALEPER